MSFRKIRFLFIYVKTITNHTASSENNNKYEHVFRSVNVKNILDTNN